MRIVVANHHGALLGGIETYLAALLSHLVAGGNEILFVHEAAITESPIPLPSNVNSLDFSQLGLASALETIRRWKPDVIYFHAIHNLDFQSALIEMAPTVAFAHSYSGLCISGSKTWKRSPAHPCAKPFDWRCLFYYHAKNCGGASPITMGRDFRRQSQQLGLLRRCDAVITHAGQMHSEYLLQGIPEDRLFVLPHLVEPPARVNSLPRDDEAVHFIYIGRFDFLKGGHLLLRSLPKVSAALRKPVFLRMLGNGPVAAEWKSSAQEVSSKMIRVEFPGWVNRERKDAFLAESHLLIVPSVWPEPFGQVGLEAGQLGVPAVAFNLGGIPAWLDDGVNGHLAPSDPPSSEGLAVAIVKSLENPGHYARLRAGAREVAARFSVQKHLLALDKVFTLVLERRR